MALTQRQIACFESNRQFLNEVAAALLPIAAQMMAESLVVLANAASTEVEQTFAAIRQRMADQVLREQGINVQGAPASAAAQATGGSTAMKNLVQQMLLMPTWTLTPNEWAANEVAARETIQASMAALLTALTATPALGQQQE